MSPIHALNDIGGNPLYILLACNSGTNKMLKIETVNQNKTFSAFVKSYFVDLDYNLYGLAIVGTSVACRAIYAGLYTSSSLKIYDSEDEDDYITVQANQSYTKVEEKDGKITHLTALPRTASDSGYNNMLKATPLESDDSKYPRKVVMSWDKAKHKKEIGKHLSDTFGLPAKDEWIEKYQDVLPLLSTEKIDVFTTDIGEEFENIAISVIEELSINDVLGYVEEAIHEGVLIPGDSNSDIEAEFEEGWSTEDYLRANSNVLVDKIDKYMKPKYSADYLAEEIGEMKRLPVPTQAKSAMGILSILKDKKGAFLSGQMGSGKTQISLAASYVKARQREKSGADGGMRVLVVAPQNVVPKWMDSEVPEILGDTCTLKPNQLEKLHNYSKSSYIDERRIYKEYDEKRFLVTLINSTKDADDYIQAIKNGWTVPKGKIHYVFIATDRMKLHAQGFALGAIWNVYRRCWISPDTGNALQSPDVKKEDIGNDEVIATWNDVVHLPKDPPTLTEIEESRENGTLGTNGLPIGYVKKWKGNIRSFQEDYSEETKTSRILDRPKTKNLDGDSRSKRWMIAELFQRKIPNHFHFGIFDEIHQMKGSGSGRGLAFHKLTKAVRKSVFLTGTLTNGESSSIQSVLWRIFPQEVLDYGFNHHTSEIMWAKEYGVVEKEEKHYKDNKTGELTNKKSTPRFVEKPGISPKLTANHLLDKSVFIDLPDLDIPMITLEEKPIIVELDEEHQEEYDEFENELRRNGETLQWEIGQAAWSKYVPSLQNYIDQPSFYQEIEYRKKDGELLAKVESTPFDTDYETPKEKKLVELVLERLEEDRGIVIYTSYTSKYKTNQRLQKVLQHYGVNPVILNDKVKTKDRFDWIDKQTEKGTKVIITNQSLVEVGLDLYAFPTIIFWQMSNQINTVRQSSKRAHRLGQNRHCEVLYLVADKTYQMKQFERLMSRRVNALLVEGSLEKSSTLAQYADLEVSQLTNDLSRSLETSEIESAWGQIAEKEFDDSLEFVSENELQKRISEAFKTLTNETLKLSGHNPDPFLNDWEKEQVGSIIDNLLDDIPSDESEQDEADNQPSVIIEPEPQEEYEDEEDGKEESEQLSLF